MKFGERLRKLRAEKEITQEELGRVLGVKVPNVSKYENNHLQPSLEMLLVLADYFGVTLDYLLGRSNMKKGRLVSKDELKNFLPPILVDNIGLEIRVEEMGLKEETKQEIIALLRKEGYIK